MARIHVQLLFPHIVSLPDIVTCGKHVANTINNEICTKNVLPVFQTVCAIINYLPQEIIHSNKTTARQVYKIIRKNNKVTPSIMVKYPNRKWTSIWKNLSLPYIPLEWKGTMYCTINDIVPTEDKKYRHNMANTPFCKKCNSIDTLKHRLTTCSNIREVWNWTLTQLKRLAPTENPNDHLRTTLHLETHTTQNTIAQAWLSTAFTHYAIISDRHNLDEFKRRLIQEKCKINKAESCRQQLAIICFEET